jgi:LacI family transcriptional regulator
MSVADQRYRGYIECLQQNGFDRDETLIIHTDFKVESAITPVHQLLDLPLRPDAIFCVNDQTAIGAMKVIRDKGLRIPEDIAVAGFDDSPISGYISPSLTSVARPGRQLGIEAARIFLQYQNATEKEAVAEHLILPPQLVIRGSTGKK